MPSRSRSYRDAWGIPHLRAAGPRQLAHAQGQNAARDRAWQIEVERHRSQGTAAAFLGAPALSWDLLARRARLDGTARRCFDALDPATAAWVTAYVDGVNTGLEQGAAAAPEFAATGLTPTPWRPWTPLGVWLAHHILFAGFPTKLWREEVARRLGDPALELFATDGPGTAGSNGWLVPGHRTAHGAPIIAGDPHRPLQNPGFYQQLHLSCPEFDVVGFAVPGVPGIAHFGHTGTVAWAITNAMADYHDLYEETLRGADDGTTDGRVEALGPDGWRPVLHRHRETVEVAGGDPVDVDVIETGRGPVIIGDTGNLAGASRAEATVISLRYPPRVTADLGFAAIPALLHARTVADIDRAFDRWIEPVNVVHAADTQGGLLHRVAGYVPVRHPDNTLRVVPARQPGHEWRGRHDTPRAEVDDLAVMANARGIATPLGAEFAPSHRANRITGLLRQSHEWTAPEMTAVHMDTQLPATTPLLDGVARLDGLTPAAARLREGLLSWDRRMDADSGAAADYARLRSAVVRRIAASPQLKSLAGPLPYPAVFEPWLNLTGKVAFALDTLLVTELLPGLDRPGILTGALEETADADPVTWGELHRLAPLRAVPDGGGDEQWPGLGGDHDCVLATSSVPGITDLSSRGPSARYVWDLADRDHSLWIVPLGANGIPGNAHHRDQLPLWANGQLAPVVTDFAQLTEETEDDRGGDDQGRISSWKSKA